MFNKFKNALIFLLYFAGIIFVANLVVGVVSLILKLSLVTVQGPTGVSVFIEIATFFIVIAIGAFIAFKAMGIRRIFTHKSELCLHMLLIIIIQIIVVLFADFNTIWLIATGTLSLTKVIYLGGIEYIESLREIPRGYYIITLMIEDIVFLMFSCIGIIGAHKPIENKKSM